MAMEIKTGIDLLQLVNDKNTKMVQMFNNTVSSNIKSFLINDVEYFFLVTSKFNHNLKIINIEKDDLLIHLLKNKKILKNIIYQGEISSKFDELRQYFDITKLEEKRNNKVTIDDFCTKFLEHITIKSHLIKIQSSIKINKKSNFSVESVNYSTYHFLFKDKRIKNLVELDPKEDYKDWIRTNITNIKFNIKSDTKDFILKEIKLILQNEELMTRISKRQNTRINFGINLLQINFDYEEYFNKIRFYEFFTLALYDFQYKGVFSQRQINKDRDIYLNLSFDNPSIEKGYDINLKDSLNLLEKFISSESFDFSDNKINKKLASFLIYFDSNLLIDLSIETKNVKNVKSHNNSLYNVIGNNEELNRKIINEKEVIDYNHMSLENLMSKGVIVQENKENSILILNTQKITKDVFKGLLLSEFNNKQVDIVFTITTKEGCFIVNSHNRNIDSNLREIIINTYNNYNK